MASASSTALVLALNLLFFTVTATANAWNSCPPSPTTPTNPRPPTPTPTPTPTTPSPPPPATPSPPSSNGTCPIDALKLAVCADLLGLISIGIGVPPREPCCTLINGLVDLEAALCLCTALRANVLGIILTLDLRVSLLINYCGMNVPSGFLCPS